MKKIISLRAKADAAIAERSKRAIPKFFILNLQYWMIFFKLINIREKVYFLYQLSQRLYKRGGWVVFAPNLTTPPCFSTLVPVQEGVWDLVSNLGILQDGFTDFNFYHVQRENPEREKPSYGGSTMGNLLPDLFHSFIFLHIVSI